MDMVPLSRGNLLLALAAAQGITGGALYLLMSGPAGWQMVPQAEWAAQGVTPGDLILNLYATFGTPPTSASWGNYVSVGETMFYLQHPEITGNMTLKQLLGLA